MVINAGFCAWIHPKCFLILMVIQMIAHRSCPRTSLFDAKEIITLLGKFGSAKAALEPHLSKGDGSWNAIFDLLLNGYLGILLVK